MAIDRTWWNNLVDDDGSGTKGTVWNKAAIKGLLDAIDGLVGPATPWTPVDASGAALTFAAGTMGSYIKIGQLVVATFTVNYPATSSNAIAAVAGLQHPVITRAAGAFGYWVGTSTPCPQLLPHPQGAYQFTFFSKDLGQLQNAALSSVNMIGFVLYFTN